MNNTIRYDGLLLTFWGVVNSMTLNNHLRFASIAASGSDSDAWVGEPRSLRSDLIVAASGQQWIGPIRRKSAEGVAGLALLGFVGIPSSF